MLRRWAGIRRAIASALATRLSSAACARLCDDGVPRAVRSASSAASGTAWTNKPERVSKCKAEDDGNRPKVLVIYTGGTIGMVPSYPGGPLAPEAGYLETQVMNMDEINSNPRFPLVDIMRWDQLVDSSNMDPARWTLLVKQIEHYYFQYDGFVVLHGTDTMAYSASALSFMFENLGKPVIFTGSQIPFFEVYNDARRNFLVSVIFAGMCEIPEVCVFFDQNLYRGNRCKKTDSWRLSAFDSPNFPPLATLSGDIRINDNLVRPQPRQRLKVHPNIKSNIAVLHLIPGFDDSFIYQMVEGLSMCLSRPGGGSFKIEGNTTTNLAGVILHLYGTGNAPSMKESFLSAIEKVSSNGTEVVAVSQCLRGSVDLSQYEVGKRLKDIGVINGYDMTIEAASTKLGYLLSRRVHTEVLRQAMGNSLRGEVTVGGLRSEDSVGKGISIPFLTRDLKHWARL